MNEKDANKAKVSLEDVLDKMRAMQKAAVEHALDIQSRMEDLEDRLAKIEQGKR